MCSKEDYNKKRGVNGNEARTNLAMADK